MKSYAETLDFLYAQLPVFERTGASAYKPGLERMNEMDRYFGHPHRCYPTIHVAGTNGKGSTSHTLASILQAAGYRVGLFTSPHLLDFDERIRINGTPIRHDYVVQWVECHYENICHLRPSFFELATMMAFSYFASEHIDIAVIEVGMGGALDSTNIITPRLSIITNIGLDHTQFLGDTLPQIASEKAGIMKRGVKCIIGQLGDDPGVRQTFEKRASELPCSILFAEESPEILSTEDKKGLYRYTTKHYGIIDSELTGLCQPLNANTILHAVRELESTLEISLDHVRKGMAQVTTTTGLTGRWQHLSSSPEIICDTGHNVDCFKYIAPRLHQIVLQGRTLHMVFGMVSDKDVAAVVDLLPTEATYHLAAASTPRSLPATEMQELLQRRDIQNIHLYNSVGEAVEGATIASRNGKNDFIFIGGSNFVVAEALQKLKE